MRRHPRAFALLELAALIAIAAALISLLLISANETRRQARLGEDISKLRQIGGWTAAYGADNQDLFWAFSWKMGQSLSQWPDLNGAPSDLQAAANQAVDILRRVAGRLDIPQIVSWLPHVYYSHLVLTDYVSHLPERTLVSSADVNRIRWSHDPKGFDQGWYQPAPAGLPGAPAGKRWPYSSSFEVPSWTYDRGGPPSRLIQANVHNLYWTPSPVTFSARAIVDVSFPADKTLLHDSNARHFGKRQPYCTHEQARLPILFVDGHASVRAAASANAGWIPTVPASSAASSFAYAPQSWEPPTMTGGAQEPVIGRFRWTRGTATEHGIAGRDFGGPETCSGQPGCP